LFLAVLETISTLVVEFFSSLGFISDEPAVLLAEVELVEVEPAEAAVLCFSPEALAAALFWKVHEPRLCGRRDRKGS